MGTPRLLFGPLTPTAPVSALRAVRASGDLLTFAVQPHPDADLVLPPTATWTEVESACPEGWHADFVVVWVPYTGVPSWVWECPLPTAALAPDWNLLGQTYRAILPRFDRVFTDEPGVEVFRRHGVDQAHPACLFGVGPEWFESHPPVERDIDVLFVGNLHPAVQRDRGRWLGRLAALSNRFRVRIATGVIGAEYRALLRRAKMVFNRSLRGECNQRVGEAVAAGALLLQESSNREVPYLLTPGVDYLPYDEENFESVVERAVADGSERETMVRRAEAKLPTLTFAAHWQRLVESLDADEAELRSRAARRTAGPTAWTTLELAGAVLGGESSERLRAQPEADPAVLGAVTADPTTTATLFEAAVATGDDSPLTLRNWAQALARGGEVEAAARVARAAILNLERAGPNDFVDEGILWPPAFDLVRVLWEEAGWRNPVERRNLLRWDMHALLADLTNEPAHYFAAALARPDAAPTRAALGCALARHGRTTEAIPHLRAAVDANPFDRAAARALDQMLADVGDLAGRATFTQHQHRLHQAAPQVVAAEDWFTQPRPTGRELASLILLCCNELAYTRLCLESVFRHTRPPFELILVDNGSTDGTGDYLRQIADQPGPERVEVIRNATNLGFPAGVNQGLAVARGEYLVLLNNDTIVTPHWLDGLIRAVASQWPSVGMSGAVSNFAGGVQQVPAAEQVPPDRVAAPRRIGCMGRTREAPMLSGFCLLMRRDVLAAVGGLDERFGLGFFDDDDLSRRVRQAGYRLAVADDVYVHHFGSRTFLGLGIDTGRQLRENHDRFRAKWGDESGPPASPLEASSPVSLTMIVRDEEANLEACLRPLRELVGEIVVVDTGSTDRTKEVAMRLGARVFDFPWVDDFAAARNEALRHATQPWIFWMDADDRLDAEGVSRLKALFAQLRDENAAYVLKCVCVPDAPGGAATVVDHVRLFRNDPRVRWRYRVHEQILPALRAAGADVRWGDVRVHHVGYVDPALRARKRERDTRLLRAELAANPDDPFALFNLGAVLHERGEWAEAVGVLERSLHLSHPRDSIVRKTYALIAQCLSRLGNRERAVATCQTGRVHYPNDAELLFLEANLHKESGDLAVAEELYRRLLTGRDDPHFASVDTGLRRYKGRHNLALVCLEQGRRAEAVELLQAAVTEAPAFLPSWYALGDLAVRFGNWIECERIAERVRQLGPDGEIEAERLTAESCAGRGEVPSALQGLELALGKHPQALPLRLIECRLRMRDGSDLVAAERAVRAVLTLAPDHPVARRDLEMLRRQSGRLTGEGTMW